MCPLETITADNISSFVAALGEDGLAVANINQPRGGSFEAGAEASVGMAEKVELSRGENHWDRVFTEDEERRYPEAAVGTGNSIEDAYVALQGIHATVRNEQPDKPEDPFGLRDATVLLIDCGLRPDECFRLRWEFIRFPAPTKSGHIEKSSLKKQHAKACASSGIGDFVLLFTLSGIPALPRGAEFMDYPYTLAYLAGHRDFSTTRRYVHPQTRTVRDAMDRAQKRRSGHNAELKGEAGDQVNPDIELNQQDLNWSGREDSNLRLPGPEPGALPG